MSDPKRTSSSSSLEKGDIETVAVSKQVSDIETRDPHDLPPVARWTQIKLDVRLIGVLMFLYALSLVDRLNISIARIAGMDAALGLTIGNRYSIIALVLFPTYFLMEVPGNFFFKKSGVRPAVYIGASVLAFGAVTMIQAASSNWQTLMGLRILLGATEGLFFPACLLLISSWYPRHQLAKRFSAFYLGGLFLGGGVLQLLAYAMGVNSVGSLEGWQCIFLWFGVITIVVAGLGIFVLIPNFPSTAKGNWHLSSSELELVNRRIQIDRHDEVHEPVSMRDVLEQLTSVRGWLASLMFCLGNGPTYAFAYFMPSILRSTLGYSVKDAQVLSAPPYLVAAAFGYVISILSDRYRVRGAFICFGSIVSLVGLIMVGYVTDVHVRYAGCYVTLMGVLSANPLIVTWASNNVRTINGRTINHAQVGLGGNIGGIMASLVFRSQDAPKYVPGLLTCLICEAVTIVIAVSMMAYFHYANRRADRTGKLIEGHPTFRYTL